VVDAMSPVHPEPAVAELKLCQHCGTDKGIILPLHLDKGGPMFCLTCGSEWHGRHAGRRKWGRIVIKAMRGYMHHGGAFEDFLKFRLVASDIANAFGIKIDGYEPDRTGAEVGDITAELLRDTLMLVHPDHQPIERREMATRVTRELTALQPFVFPAPKPDPEIVGDTSDALTKVPPGTAKEPSPEPAYPCEHCADEIPYYYCTTCRAEWVKRQRAKDEVENAKRRAWYRQRQARRRLGLAKPRCPICGGEVAGKRKDTVHCSARCRQTAYRRRQRNTGVTGKKYSQALHLKTRHAGDGAGMSAPPARVGRGFWRGFL
jgi:hypothetical protein